MHKIICICNHGPTSDPHRPLHCRGRLVLTSYYKIERQKVADSLAKLLPKAGVQCASLEPVLDALARFRTSFFGGKGRIPSVVVGGLIIGTISNGLNMLHIQTFYQLVVMGSLIIIAVSVDRLIGQAK